MKKLILLSILCLFTITMFAQQNAFNWRVGAYGGYNIYRGDLNSGLDALQVSHPLNNLPNTDWQDLLSYGGSLEYSTKSFGIKLLGTRGIFQANDRAIDRSGNSISHTDFNRSLNVETQLYDASILATFYSDNGRMLSKKAFVSPYLSIGFGGTFFEVYSDLLDANNQQYYYWSDGLIYNKPEDTQPTDAIQLTQDGTFESNITDLNKEGVDYNNITWNIPVAVGLKFRISDRMNANVEVMARYVNTDYLDDVSTRGNSSDKDYYGLASLSLHYNFGRKAENFLPPTFYSLGGNDATTTTTATTTPETTKVETEVAEVPVTVEQPKPTKKPANAEATAKPVDIIAKTNPNAEYIEPKAPKKLKETPTSSEPISIITPTDNQPEAVKNPTKIVEKVKERPVEVITKTNPKIENIVVTEPTVEIDSQKVVLESVETPSFLLNDKTFSVEKQTYLDVQKTRLEVATLNEEANNLLENYDATKVDSFAILNQKIDELSKDLKDYQQYMTSLAIQGNTDYTKPENQAIEKQTSALEEETAALRQKYNALVLGEDAPKVIETELEKIKKENETNKAKIAALEAEVIALETVKSKVETKTETTVIEIETTEIATKPEPTTPTIETTVNPPIRTVENIVLVPVDTSNVQIRAKRPVLSDSMAQIVNTYDVQLKALTDEVSRLNTEVIPAKDKTIESLTSKVNSLEGELKGIEKTNKYWADLFQKQIASLQSEIAKLNQTPVSSAPIVETKIVEKVVEKIVQVPTEPTTKTISLQDIVNDFGVANVYFGVGQTGIKSEFYTKLDRVANLMNQHSEIVVTLKGYTDKSGNPEANFKLSKKRAEAVKAYLLRKGVSPSKVDISYFGENNAAAANDPFSRRVEVILVVN